MTGREVYEIWAKEGAKWTEWVRPVPFIAIDDNVQIMEFYDLNIPDIFYLKEIPSKTAIIVDEEGYESVKEGIYTLSTLFPGVCYILAGLLMMFAYPLTKKVVEGNIEKLASLRASK